MGQSEIFDNFEPYQDPDSLNENYGLTLLICLIVFDKLSEGKNAKINEVLRKAQTGEGDLSMFLIHSDVNLVHRALAIEEKEKSPEKLRENEKMTEDAESKIE